MKLRIRNSALGIAILLTLACGSTALGQSTADIAQLRQAAEKGDAAASYRLGIAFRDGIGVTQDYAEAFHWLELAGVFAIGEDQKTYFAAANDLYGKLTPAQLTDSNTRQREQMQRLAAAGHPRAQFTLGIAYHNGFAGILQDFAKAVEWFQKAANQSERDAQFMLAKLYRDGTGVAADPAKASEWLRKAAALGQTEAQFFLGDAYFSGYGVPQDYTQAIQWWRKAADEGHAIAPSRLGDVYRQNDKGVAQDYAQAAAWYRKSAEHGWAHAQFNLGSLYERGLGVPQDGAQAVQWYRRAAEQGHATAQYNLGILYADGKAVPRDYIEAHKWVNLAAARTTSEFQKQFADARDRISKTMTPEQIAEAQTRARLWMQEFGAREAGLAAPPPPPPPPPPAPPIRVGGDIPEPTKTKDVKPDYPAIAISARVQGVVIMEAAIGTDGKVVDAKVLYSPSPLLDIPALAAVKQWEYTPTLVNGVPVPVTMTVTVKFSLQ